MKEQGLLFPEAPNHEPDLDFCDPATLKRFALDDLSSASRCALLRDGKYSEYGEACILEEYGRSYRYRLARRWSLDEGLICWIMLNPSTADAMVDDATIRKVRGFTKAWGYGGFEVVNLYGFRATKPKDLFECPRPEGERNRWFMREAIKRSKLVVAAWGAHGEKYGHGRRMRVHELRSTRLMCLGKTKHGEPKHPLYISYETALDVLSEAGEV